MQSIKIKTFGWKCPPLDVISRIDEGLINNGAELTDNEPDILYKNNDFFDDAWEFYDKCNKKPFTIFNILDLQLDTWGRMEIEKLEEDLNSCNQVTCISETVKKDIQKIFNIDAKVIYNPAKPTYSLGLTRKTFPFLFVGRTYSKNKRFDLIKETLNLAHWPNSYLKVCGPENPFFGQYQGVVDDENLNNLYNNAGVVLLLSSKEGIGLSFIEALQTYTPTIGCSDCEAAQEFLPNCMICDPYPISIKNKILEIQGNYDYYKQVAFERGVIYKEQFSANSVGKRILDIYINAKN